MKKTIIFAALALSAVTAGAQQTAYSIKGVCADNSKKIYLVDQLTSESVDSAVVKNGKFALKGSAEKDALMAVHKEGSGWYTPFINDGTPITINVNDSTLKGSQLNERLTAYDREATRKTQDLENFIKKLQGMSQQEQQAQQMVFMLKANDLISYVNDIFKNNTDNLIPLAFLDGMMELFDEEQIEEVFNSKNAYANHPYAKKVKKEYDDYMAKQKAEEEAKQKVIGQRFTDLEEPDTDGKMHKLSEYVGQGRWVLIDFWASWCGPCRAEMPNVVAAYEKYHAKGFDIVGLSFDNKKGAWVKAIADLNMPWTHLSDLKGWQTVAAQTYGINSIPASLLVDPEGNIVARDLRGPALGAKLAEIFGE